MATNFYYILKHNLINAMLIATTIICSFGCKTSAYKNFTASHKLYLRALHKLNLSPQLQQVKLKLNLKGGRRGLVKFCRPEDSCTFFPVATGKVLDLTFAPHRAVISVKVCEASHCRQPWQAVLLNYIDKYDGQKRQQLASTIGFFTDNNTKGATITALGDNQSVYTYTVKLHAALTYAINSHFKKDNPKLSLARAGLKNLGNTCFFNAALQVLASSPELSQKVSELASSPELSQKVSEVAKKGDNKSWWRSWFTAKVPAPQNEASKKNFFTALNTLLEKMDGSLEAVGYSDITPVRKAFNALQAQSQQHYRLHKGRQDDAGEFLGPILDSLFEDDKQSIKLQEERTGLNTKEQVNNLFNLEMTVDHSNTTGNALLPQYAEVAKLKEHNSLQQLVVKNFSKKISYEEETTAEEKAKGAADIKQTTKKDSIVSSGKTLDSITFNIQRTKFSQSKVRPYKSPQEVDFGFLDSDNKIMVPFIDSEKNLMMQEMQLKSVIIHQGSQPGSGHYYTYFCDEKGAWFEANDSRVSPVTNIKNMQNDMSKNATILNMQKSTGAAVGVTQNSEIINLKVQSQALNRPRNENEIHEYLHGLITNEKLIKPKLITQEKPIEPEVEPKSKGFNHGFLVSTLGISMFYVLGINMIANLHKKVDSK